MSKEFFEYVQQCLVETDPETKAQLGKKVFRKARLQAGFSEDELNQLEQL